MCQCIIKVHAFGVALIAYEKEHSNIGYISASCTLPEEYVCNGAVVLVLLKVFMKCSW